MINSIELKYCKRQAVDGDWRFCSGTNFQPELHIHPNRLHYVHNGSPIIYCNEKPYVLEPGNLYFFPQNLSFRAEMPTSTMEYDHTALDFYAFPPIRLQEPIVIKLEDFPLIQSATDVLRKFATTYPIARYGLKHEYLPLIESYCINLMQLIDKSIAPIETVSSPFIADVLNYIHENYQKDLTIETLSALTNYQKHVFIRKFKQITGVTPYKYIKNYRMNCAFHLMQSGKHSTTQVAELIGYKDTTSFSHAFSQYYGFRPTKFK